MWQCPNLAPEEMQLGSAGWGRAVVFSNRDIDTHKYLLKYVNFKIQFVLRFVL